MSNDTRPEIRFPGFTEDWEERKLGDMMDVTSVKRIHQSDWTNSGIRFLRARDIVSAAKNEEPSDYLYISEEKYNEYSKISGKVSQGDLLVTGVGSIGVPLLITDDNPIYFKDGNIIWFKNEHKIDGNFFYYSFINNKIQKYIRDVAGIGTVGTYTIDSGKKTPISLPTYDEQIKIGSFFKQLDHTIALHQRKLDLLKETKKGFLQKMFPKNGAKVPEIRFPGFTEDWEERKFGEIVQVSRGLTYKPSDVQIEGIRVLRSSNINEDVFVLRDDDVFVKPDAVNIAPIKNGDILITSANGSSRLVGKHAIVNGLQDKTVHGGFMLRVKSKNTWFTNSLMSSRWYNYFINIYVSGGNGAIGNLRKYDLESQTIIVPDDEEQQKIGAFFKQLDDTIALHQRKLDLLKETKKGFLQKMFV
ncbi:restriction endonuclease subunit S [Enterococcus faecium]|uniref:restriction endonuclease subunit S n=1 Tax=Enterococcus faecium TaxID=1352 RepID=UPI0024157F4D|nr:restriction endonuclease subunit S [Enterococcus faecium]MDG4614497.1 restriction endonuclease subunit S [Enterococcus faecium]